MRFVKSFIFVILAFVVTTCFVTTGASFASNQIYTVDRGLIAKHSKDKYWYHLLHYQNGKSTVEDTSFFLSETRKGLVSLELELEKTIEAFFSLDRIDDSHAICKYPARFKWIKSTFSLNDNLFPKPNCKEFNHYFDAISAQTIYISFASENLKNPTSMMGHPFLKIEGSHNGKKVENAVTYFGDYGSENILKFYAKSITSGVKGVFLVEPYQKKLDFYNDEQKRTIWEFKVNLTKDQIDNLVMHIWELNGVDIKYHFVFHNCVTALVDLMKVAEIDNIKNDVLVTPIEVIDEMYDLGYINNNVSLYPSYDYQFRIISNSLNNSEKKEVVDVVHNYNVFNYQINKSNNLQSDANILFASKVALKANSLSNPKQKRQYFDTISKIDDELKQLPEQDLKYDVKNPFSRSKTAQITFGYSKENHKNVAELGFYPVYNSFRNDNSEYLNEFELKLLSLQSKYYQESKKFRVDNIDILKIQSIIDSDNAIGGWSSGLRINFEREDNFINTSRLYPNIEINIGKAKQIFQDKILVYLLLTPSYSYYKDHSNPYIYSEIGLFIRNIKDFKTHINYRKYISSESDYKYQELFSIEEIFFVTKNHNLILGIEKSHGNLNDTKKLYLDYQYNF